LLNSLITNRADAKEVGVEAEKKMQMERRMRSYLYKKIFLVAVIAVLVVMHESTGMPTPNDTPIPVPNDLWMILFVTGISGLLIIRRQ